MSVTNPTTPKDLELAGYRIEYGVIEGGANGYWWTWTRDGAGIETSEGSWPTAAGATEDARRDLVTRRRFDSRETAAILAGLRLLQLEIDSPYDGGWFGDALKDVYTNGGEFEGLRSDEIDVLCERVNFGDY
jgi:hypothetical protein